MTGLGERSLQCTRKEGFEEGRARRWQLSKTKTNQGGWEYLGEETITAGIEKKAGLGVRPARSQLGYSRRLGQLILQEEGKRVASDTIACQEGIEGTSNLEKNSTGAGSRSQCICPPDL